MIYWVEKRRHGQIELRGTTANLTQILLIIGKGGWKFGKREKPGGKRGRQPNGTYLWEEDTSPYSVRLSMNGPAFLTDADWCDLQTQIVTAKLGLDTQVNV